MKKSSKVFVCQSCGVEYPRWAGKCESCGEWNTIIEETGKPKFQKVIAPSNRPKRYSKPILLSSVNEKFNYARVKTGFSELDLVLGGGIVPGSLVLIGGEPGAGKSTLILEISRRLSKNHKIIYISGEESSSQIALRAKRMEIDSGNIFLSSECIAENIVDMVVQEKPSFVFIDSIQTISSELFPNQAGTVTQLRECTQIFLETAKKTNIPFFLIGHITKEGNIAGPKILEHLVDTVLYFEGDRLNYYRLLRAVKNRFGAVGDLAVFEMKSNGLSEVVDKHNIFLTQHDTNGYGSIVSVVMEGSRAMSVEVQALVSRTSYSQARRMAEGLDNRRLILMAAVLEKFMGLKMVECDIFSNLAGGLNIDEPALDLAICASISSSYVEKAVPFHTAILGEVGLSGEVRPVSHINIRIKELNGIGIKEVFLPKINLQELDEKNFGIKFHGIQNIKEMEKLFL